MAKKGRPPPSFVEDICNVVPNDVRAVRAFFRTWARRWGRIRPRVYGTPEAPRFLVAYKMIRRRVEHVPVEWALLGEQKRVFDRKRSVSGEEIEISVTDIDNRREPWWPTAEHPEPDVSPPPDRGWGEVPPSTMPLTSEDHQHLVLDAANLRADDGELGDDARRRQDAFLAEFRWVQQYCQRLWCTIQTTRSIDYNLLNLLATEGPPGHITATPWVRLRSTSRDSFDARWEPVFLEQARLGVTAVRTLVEDLESSRKRAWYRGALKCVFCGKYARLSKAYPHRRFCSDRCKSANYQSEIRNL